MHHNYKKKTTTQSTLKRHKRTSPVAIQNTGTRIHETWKPYNEQKGTIQQIIQ